MIEVLARLCYNSLCRKKREERLAKRMCEVKRIGMVIAVEIQSVLSKYADRLKEENVPGFRVYSVELDDKTLYITRSGAGEIRAAAAVQMLISVFHVELIVNYGVVGALTERLEVINTCVVEKAVHYDFDTSAADACEVGRYLEYKDIYLRATAEYVKLATEYDAAIFPVTCASGDKFIAAKSEKEALSKAFKADICDMESAAIILVCDLNQVPNLIVKTVSDSIKGGTAEFRSCFAKAADTCLAIVDRIIKTL